MKNFISLIKIFLLLGASVLQLGNIPVTLPIYTDTQEYTLKAAFIYRFIEYVDWKNSSESETFNIAILEESPITLPLLEITKNKKAKGKKINVEQYKNMDEIDFCNILFVPVNCSIPIETIFAKLANKPVLIVTEHEGYGKKGAHLNFVIVENKLKFEVNPKAINKAGIVVSSFLLQHAIIVE
ncbi:MAG: YfiR family protein [Bacteroidetes bacterium]|nr:YfiR family protein [Bacteroidota bacterium]